MYKYLLFDLDNTLLDFTKAERKALHKTFDEFSVPFSDINVSVFKKYNKKYWELFEEGKIAKEELLVRRFNDFFSEIEINYVDSVKFNSFYLNALSDGTEEIDHAYELLESLSNYKIAIITNGVTHTQNERIRKSRLGKFFDKVYISEQIGYQKPKKEFFDYVFKDLNIKSKDEVLLIGDSITSDILGGINYQIDTVWYNPKHEDSKIKAKYVIKDLMDLLNILK